MNDLFQKIRIDLRQGSDEWLEWRKDKIGASEAPIIMNDSPYKSKYQLWHEKKTGQVTAPKNDYVLKKGHEIEDMQRLRLESELGVNLHPYIFSHKDFPYITASFDGVCLSGSAPFLWECKYVSREIFNRGEVPQKYFAQLAQQVWIVASHVECQPHMTLTLFNYDGQHLDINVNTEVMFKDYIESQLAPAVLAFKESLSQDNYTDDELWISDSELDELAEQYKEVKKEHEIIDEKLKSLTTQIFGKALAESNRVEAHGLLITKSVSKPKREFDIELAKEDYPDIVNVKYTKEIPGRITKRITIRKEHE